ncbi:hypothetical protein D3C71_1802480 [compost metagenome]
MTKLTSRTSESTNHLIHNEQHTVLTADFLHPIQINLMRYNDATTRNYRLHNHRSYRLHAFPDDHILYGLCTLEVEFFHSHPGRAAIAVRGSYMQKPACQRFIFIFALGLARCR